MDLYTQLHHISNVHLDSKHVMEEGSMKSKLTVPPIEASSTPSETGKTANLGLGKLMSKEVDNESAAESI